MKRWSRGAGLAVMFGVLLCLSLGVNAVQSERMQKLRLSISMDRQRDLSDRKSVV